MRKCLRVDRRCLDWSYFTILFVTKFFGVAIAASAGGPGGVIYPALVIGSSLGG